MIKPTDITGLVGLSDSTGRSGLNSGQKGPEVEVGPGGLGPDRPRTDFFALKVQNSPKIRTLIGPDHFGPDCFGLD